MSSWSSLTCGIQVVQPPIGMGPDASPWIKAYKVWASEPGDTRPGNTRPVVECLTINLP